MREYIRSALWGVFLASAFLTLLSFHSIEMTTLDFLFGLATLFMLRLLTTREIKVYFHDLEEEGS